MNHNHYAEAAIRQFLSPLLKQNFLFLMLDEISGFIGKEDK